ncbi:MAG: TldD/PmbA family protein [Methanomassiliicoccales archaeon]
MNDEMQRAVGMMEREGAGSCDARYQEMMTLTIKVVDGTVRSLKRDRMGGICLRSRIGGTWGYSTTVDTDKDSISRAAREAVRQAGMGDAPGEPLPKAVTESRTMGSGAKMHPVDICLEDKLEAVNLLDQVQRVDDRVANTNSTYTESVRKNTLVNSFGAEKEWEEVRTAIGCMTVAADSGRTEFHYDSKDGTKGFELIMGSDLQTMGAECGQEAVKMLSAGKPPSGEMVCITDPGITGTLAHEVIGHAAEADEVVKGRSFLTGRVGEQVASEDITMIDDGTLEGAHGSIPLDDEGVPSFRSVLIQDGVYSGYLHTLETAATMGVEPTGNGRAEDYSRRVWARMTNTFFEPGDWTLDEMVEDMRYGIVTDKPISGMEDPVGGGFEAQALRGYLVEKGEIQGMVRSFALTGDALEILKTTDAVGLEFRLDGGFCGKGIEDMVPVSAGGPYCRSRIVVGGD